MKLKICTIIKSVSYTEEEPYQHQLFHMLHAEHDVFAVEYTNLKQAQDEIKSCDAVFALLPVRHIVQNIDEFEAALNGKEIIIADYDPWVFFEDSSQYQGGYKKLIAHLNVKSFFVASQTWCDFLNRLGYHAVFSQIGMQPSYCRSQDFAQRTISLEFRGASYPVREAQFARLKSAGLDVPWQRNKIFPYQKFLDHLQSVKCWAQNEDEPIVIYGEKILHRNWLWPKAIEVLSQGCFLIRNRDPESHHYDIQGLPTALLFDDISEASKLYETILSMSDAEKNERSQATVAALAKRDVYREIAHKLESWFYDD